MANFFRDRFLSGLSEIHFLGIGGTAMGAVAAMFKREGVLVTGSDDQVYPPMSTFLREAGIDFYSGYDPRNLPANRDVMIVVGNTIKRGNPEVEAVLNEKRFYLSLPEVLKNYFLRGKRNVVVTGTHGKTTTSSIVAWILEKARREPSFLIGGIPENFGFGCRKGCGEFWVLEGDEYDSAFFDKRSKFLHYLPEIVIINNIEFDHADIYENLDAIKLSFLRLMNIVPSNGLVVYNADDPHAAEVASRCLAKKVGVTFNSQKEASSYVDNWAVVSEVELSSAGSSFSLWGYRFSLSMAGEINVRNAAMAIVAMHLAGIPLDEIAQGIATFKGVRRRQQLRGRARGVAVIDDFGHHPTAIRQTIAAVRQQYPGARLWAVFEPRSNTTRRVVFQNDLPEALAKADGVCVAKVAALEQIPPHERLNPERVVLDIQSRGVPAYYEPDAEAIIARLLPLLKEGDVVLILSNGGFGGIHEKLLKALQES